MLELDHVRWNQERTERNDEAVCLKIIDDFVCARESWIVEGLHSTLLEVVLSEATGLHFLNPPFEVCKARALARPWDPKKSSSPESQLQLVKEYEAWFRSYDTRTDETSLQAHRKLFGEFAGIKLEHNEEQAVI